MSVDTGGGPVDHPHTVGFDVGVVADRGGVSFSPEPVVP